MVGRTWVAVILSCFVWFGYLKWFAPKPPSAEPQQSSPTEPKNSPVPAETLVETIASQSSPIDFSMNTPGFELGLSNQGGRVSKVALTQYRDSIGPDAPLISLIDELNTPLSLATLFSDPELKDLSGATYVSEKGEKELHFSAANGSATIEKNYIVPASGYSIPNTIKISFKRHKENWGYLLVPVGRKALQYDANDPLHSWEIVVLQNDSLVRKTSEDIAEGETVLQGQTAWVAFGNRYFTTAIASEGSLNPDVVLKRDKDWVGVLLRFPLSGKDDGVVIPLRYYIGPKDTKELAAIPRLTELIDYGVFSFLAFPLLKLLQFFYSVFHNYGIAIILLTILVRLVFYPLSVKSSRSMKSMQKLQPQIQSLKEKYKDDLQKFNQEQMALFKTHKVNPMGGCLPMLVQIPVFIALYSLLANSVELFHSPFFGWIHDLSAKDPYYIFPVLMGLSMLLQQKMTPMVGLDPMQAKMMYLMPVIFTFIMLKLPAGLTAYIFLSTLLGILQQWLINRERPQAPRLAQT